MTHFNPTDTNNEELRYQPRDQNTGQYTYTVDCPCVCGHGLEYHTALSPRACGNNGTGLIDCDCLKYRPSRKKTDTNPVDREILRLASLVGTDAKDPEKRLLDYITSRDQQIALAALEDLRGEFAHDIDLESAYDYDYQIAGSTIKAHNKIISAKNAERADVRAAIDERIATLKAQEKS